MQIVINISDEEYEHYKNLKEYGYGTMFNSLVERIANGVVLPKGYGRLIDADELPISSIDITDLPYDDKGLAVVLLEDIECAPTVIEADKEGK